MVEEGEIDKNSKVTCMHLSKISVKNFRSIENVVSLNVGKMHIDP